MEEKILAKGDLFDIAKLRKFFIIIGVIAFVIVSMHTLVFDLHDFDDFVYNLELYFEFLPGSHWSILFALYFLVGFALIGQLIYLCCHAISITVSDKRVYGQTSFGKRVDLPIDSVSAVGTGIFKSISISTSSGRISFMAIKNRDEIHEILSGLLIERQGKPAIASVVKQETSQSNADELKKYKDLLDGGVITQEEFDAKKKQLLGL